MLAVRARHVPLTGDIPMSDDTCTDLCDRIKDAENSLQVLVASTRWWKRLGCLALVCAFTFALGGAQRADIPVTVEAEGFNLRDEDGGYRAQLRLDPRFKQPGLMLYYGPEAAAAFIELDQHGMPGVCLFRSDQHPGVMMSIGETDNEASLDVIGEQRNTLNLGAKKDESTLLLDIDKDGKRLFAVSDGPGTLELYLFGKEKQSPPRLGLIIGADGQPILGLIDKDGKALFRSPAR